MDRLPLIFKTVTADEEGIRLDRWLTRHFPALSHGCIQKNLRHKKIRVNNQKASAADRLTVGNAVSLPRFLLENIPHRLTCENEPSLALRETVRHISSWVLYQDENFLVLNKPHGLSTQGGTGLKTSVDQALNLFLGSKGKKAYLVHRLDKDTSGLLLVALKPSIATQLGTLFQNHQIQKIYRAICVGALLEENGRHEIWMAKRPGRTGEKMEVVLPNSPGALRASCTYRVLASKEDLSLVELHPQTGRTHQLRLQMAEMGCPILGDGKYGGKRAHPAGCQTLHLHAQTLVFTYPVTEEKMIFEAPIPPYFQKTMEKNGFDLFKTQFVHFSHQRFIASRKDADKQ